MLIINGNPIKNCLDFYEHFDVAEILMHPKEFTVFAVNHMKFNALNEHCIEVFERASSAQKLFSCTSEMSFWQGKLGELKVTEKIKNVVTETYVYYKKYGKDSGDNEWERKFVMATAAAILAGKAFAKPAEKQSVKKNSGEITLNFDKDVTVLTLIPGKSYSFKYDPSMKIDDGMKLRTVELLVTAGYSSAAAIILDDETKLEYNSGDRIYVNVCSDTAVRVLPNEVSDAHGVLQRDYKMGCITYNGEKTGIPVDASSFASMGKGKYLYIRKHQLSFLGIDSAIIPYALYSAKVRYVEVMVKDSEYYLLSQKGIVKTRTGTPPDMHAHYLSLQEALKEN